MGKNDSMVTKLMTCTYFVKGKRVLMADQQNKIIGRKGYGGAVVTGETWRECCNREVLEETGAEPALRIHPLVSGGIYFEENDLIPFALITFYNGDDTEVPFGSPSCIVHFSRCTTFRGTPVNTIEMKNHRYHWINRLPKKKMISGDSLFITPETLTGKTCKMGWIRHTADLKQVIDYNIWDCPLDALLVDIP